MKQGFATRPGNPVETFKFRVPRRGRIWLRVPGILTKIGNFMEFYLHCSYRRTDRANLKLGRVPEKSKI